MDLSNKLNTAQVDAATTTEGPLLILAGAGSGKTRTLIYRIAHLIINKKIFPDRILAVTFTNKAAKEMLERLNNILSDYGYTNFSMPWMGTFHSICVRFLRIEGKEAGINSHFVIYDEEDRNSLIKQIIKKLHIDDKNLKVKAAAGAISNAKNKLIMPDEYVRSADYLTKKEIGNIYIEYEKIKKNSGALDFDDLLLETVKILEKRQDIRDKWQNRFQYILVDEYQDTNLPQYRIIKLLANKSMNVCVVGDDWQSIYSWRGADFTNILNFKRDFPGAKVVKLEQNYRSTSSILGAASKVIEKNQKRTDKKLWTNLGEGRPVEIWPLRDEAEEALMVANTIIRRVKTGEYNFNDFAILYRTNAQSYPFERAFIQLKIPYQIIGGVRFYDRREVKDIIAYLKLIYQPNDIVSFSRIANVPSRKIGQVSLSKFIQFISDNNYDVITGLNKISESNQFRPNIKNALESLGKILSDLRDMSEQKSPAELIKDVIQKINYMDYLDDGTPQVENRKNNMDALASDALNFADLSSFLEDIALLSSTDTANSDNKVTLMTVHAAKGLEFLSCFYGWHGRRHFS